MPPKQMTGGMIDPLMNFSLIKASDVRMLHSGTPEMYTSKNYMAEFNVSDVITGSTGGGKQNNNVATANRSRKPKPKKSKKKLNTSK